MACAGRLGMHLGLEIPCQVLSPVRHVFVKWVLCMALGTDMLRASPEKRSALSLSCAVLHAITCIVLQYVPIVCLFVCPACLLATLSEDTGRAGHALIAQYAMLVDPVACSKLVANMRLATGLFNLVASKGGGKDNKWVSLGQLICSWQVLTHMVCEQQVHGVITVIHLCGQRAWRGT
jgi:hypothetical protein